jgi:hypothetical protein
MSPHIHVCHLKLTSNNKHTMCSDDPDLSPYNILFALTILVFLTFPTIPKVKNIFSTTAHLHFIFYQKKSNSKLRTLQDPLFHIITGGDRVYYFGLVSLLPSPVRASAML